MSLAKLLKKTRVEMGFTQSELASRSEVGLATLQNIEADRANPEIATLEKILKPLGLELIVQRKLFSWDIWISLGVPLLQNQDAVNIRPEKSLLLQQFSSISQTLSSFAKARNSREEAAFYSFLSALHDHYPSTFAMIRNQKLILINEMRKKTRPKLRRLALAKLQEYL